MKVSRIYLYGCSGIDIDNVMSFLSETFDVACVSSFLARHHNTIQNIKKCTIGDIHKPHTFGGDTTPITYNNHLLHDGYQLLDVLSDTLLHEPGTFHMIFTDLLVCTYDYSDSRYHARAAILANPCIISIPGMIEAPAKSREYYIDVMTGNTSKENMSKYDGKFLTYDKHDHSRLQTVAQGYCMQCIFYYMSGEAFCTDKRCRLYNAHWQSDLLYSQIDSGKLCDYHDGMLQNIRDKK